MLQLNILSNRLLAVTVVGFVLLLLLLSILSVQHINRLVSQYSTLVATSIEVKLEIATAHLWLEEIISGDKNESIETVWYHYGKASQHIDEILEGSNVSLANVVTVDDTQIWQDFKDVKKQLIHFRAITLERFNLEADAGAGSEIDQKYDAIFVDLLNRMDKVINALKLMMRNDLEKSRLIHQALILLILMTVLVIGFLLYSYRKRLMVLFNDQLTINQSLSENKKRLQDIAYCGGDWLWEVDSSVRYTYVSENVADIIGYCPDEMIGRTPFELMPAEESERVAEIFADIVMKQEKIIDLDNWNIHKNGKRICLRTNGVPVFDAKGQLSGYRGVDIDVTEKKAMNDVLMRTQKMDALGKLTGGIAHDFNNMLGVILGYSEILQKKLPVDDKLNEYAHQIYNAAERARKLTIKLLAFSREESFTAVETDVNQLLRDNQHMLEKTLTARIRLQYELEVDLWHVCLDRSALEDAILNISINAMHAIIDTGLFTVTTLNIRLDAEDVSQLNIKPGNYVAISFADTGEGMDEATQLKVFDPFFTTKGDSGIGLGLSQVYGFVQQSGGSIHVSSQPGQGTRMVIYLPRSLNTATVAPEMAVAVSLWDYSGDETILVVDDEAALCDLAKEMLSAYGYSVLCATSGEQALTILETQSVDLLFSDAIMPNMDGYELVSRVKMDYPDIKIQMTSGFSERSNHREFDEILHQQRLVKPYSSKKLLQNIRALLDRK